MSMVELPGGRCATEGEALNAMAAEAKRRGVSYGKLMANTTKQDREKIVRDYCASKRYRVRKK